MEDIVKRLLFLLVIVVMATSAQAQDVVLKLGERSMFPVPMALDSSGLPRLPDSLQVAVNGSDGTQVNRSWTTYSAIVGSTGWCDSALYGGGPFLFINVWADSILQSMPLGTKLTLQVKTFTKLLPLDRGWTCIRASANLAQLLARLDTTMSWAFQNFVNVTSVSPGAIEPGDFSAAPDVNITKVVGTAVSVNVAGMLKVDVIYGRGSLLDVLEGGRIPSVGITEQGFAKGAVATGTGTDSSFVCAALTQASGHWVNARLKIFSGTHTPKVLRVVRSTLQGGQDTIVFRPKLSSALGNGDSVALVVTGLYNFMAAVFADSAITDTGLVRKVWEADSQTYNNVANSFGALVADPNYMGAGSGTSNWTNAQRDSVLAGITDAGKIKTRLDSLANALADVNMRAKISWTWIGAAVAHYIVDTMAGSQFGTMGVRIRLAGDSTLYVQLADMGITIDTVNDASATTTQFIGKRTWGGTDGARDKAVVFMTGTLAQITRRCTAYNVSTKTYTIDAAPSAPANGVIFITHPIGSSQSVVDVTLAAGQLTQIAESLAVRLLLTPANKLKTDASGYVDLGITFPTNFNLFSIDGQGRVDVGRSRGVTVPYFSGVAGDTFPPVNAARISNSQQAADYLEDILSGVSRTISASLSGSVGSVSGGMGGSVAGNVGGNVQGGVLGPVASVTAPVTVGTNNDKGGYQLSAAALQAIWAVDSAGLITSPSMAWLVYQAAINADTSAGAINCLLDPDSIRAWVWNALQVDHLFPGSFGSLLDAKITSISGLAGNGAFSYDCVVMDTTGSPDTVLTGSMAGKVYVNNLQQNTRSLEADIRNDGVAHFQLNAGTWTKWITTPGYAQLLDTFTISASLVDTLMVRQGDVGRSLLAFNLGDASGVRYGNSNIRIELRTLNDTSTLFAGDSLVAANGKGYVDRNTNSQGQVTIPLYPNSTFTNDSTWYRVWIKSSANGRLLERWCFRMPQTPLTVSFASVAKWKDTQ